MLFIDKKYCMAVTDYRGIKCNVIRNDCAAGSRQFSLKVVNQGNVCRNGVYYEKMFEKGYGIFYDSSLLLSGCGAAEVQTTGNRKQKVQKR